MFIGQRILHEDASSHAFIARCPRASLVLVVVGLATIGCVQVEGRQQSGSDSAGVSIVFNGPLPETRMELTVDTSTVRHFPVQDLSRVGNAYLLSDGSIVAADVGADRLVIVSTTSNEVRVIGRRGSGPNEFRGIRGMWICTGDSIVVRSGIAELRVFDRHGELASARADASLRRPVFGVSPDCGSLAMARTQQAAEHRQTLQIGWQSRRTDSMQVSVEVEEAERQPILYLGEIQPVLVPFAARPIVTVSAKSLWIGRSNAPEIGEYDHAGRLVRLVRWKASPLRITMVDRALYSTMRSYADTFVGPGTSRQLADIDLFELPEFKPHFSDLRATRSGQIWLRTYPAFWERYELLYGAAFTNRPSTWVVFDSTGRTSTTATLPAGFMLKDVQRGALLGTTSDLDGGTQLTLYRCSICR